MGMELHKGWPRYCLEDSYPSTLAAGLQPGMMCRLNSSTGKLEKATGSAGEYAMLVFSPQTDHFIENGEKVTVIKGNGSFWTTYFKSGVSYTPGCRLQVSASVGEEGILTVYDPMGTAPVIGRYIKTDTIKGQTMILFDLVGR